MKFKERFQYIREADRAISAAQGKPYLYTQFSISIIVASAFLLLTLFNLFSPTSPGMLVLTAASALLLYLTSFLGLWTGRSGIIKHSELLVCAVSFTIFTIIEGNDGFAALWLILAPLVAVTIVDFDSGLIVGLYFFVMIVILFWTPVRDLLHYQAYTQTFLIRFPVLYLISFIFATYISIRIRDAQYRQLLQQKQLQKYQSHLENDLTRLTYQYESAEYRATHDELTGLFNREHLQTLRTQGEYDDISNHAIAFFDINGLKLANDTDGHRAGDTLLIITSESLTNSFGHRGRLFRVGGDEFLLILPSCSRGELEGLLENWRLELRRLNQLRNTNCVVAVGYAFGEEAHERNLDNLIREADAKMYLDKRQLKADGK